MRITLYLAALLVLCKKGDSVETTVSPQKENNEMDLCKVHIKNNLSLFIGLDFYQTELQAVRLSDKNR